MYFKGKGVDQTIVTPGKTLKFEKIELRPHLIILYPQTQFKQIALEKGTVTLGRGQDADIRLDDELVSRKHCTLTFDGIHVTVEDLGSTNGTFVDGQPVVRASLDSDNRLQLGKMVMKIEFKDKSEEAFDRALYEAATIDPLTKISNRRNFFDRSLGELALARRNNYYVHTIMPVTVAKNSCYFWAALAPKMPKRAPNACAPPSRGTASRGRIPSSR